MTIAKDVRAQLGLTQMQMAERLGVSQPTIARFEGDDNELSERDRLALLALLAIQDGHIEAPAIGEAA